MDRGRQDEEQVHRHQGSVKDGGRDEHVIQRRKHGQTVRNLLSISTYLFDVGRVALHN